MAPEQLLGKPPDARTDLYAAGAVLYELATGQRPFGPRSSVALTDAILHELPPPPRSVAPSVPVGLEAVILKALDKDPELRFQSAKELLVDLERLQVRTDSRSAGSILEVVATRQGTVSTDRRRRVMVASGAIVVLGTVGWLLRPLAPPRITNIRPLRLDVGPESFGAGVPTWTTDGVRLYYVRLTKGRYSLFQVALSGGEPVEIPTPFENHLEVHGYLRRYSSLIVLGDPATSGTSSAVWLVPLPGGGSPPAR